MPLARAIAYPLLLILTAVAVLAVFGLIALGDFVAGGE